MSEPVDVYPFGIYAGHVPTFVAEMIETLRVPTSFDQESYERLGLDKLELSQPEIVAWALVSHEEATAEQAGRHLNALWGGQNGDGAAKLPGCPYWLLDLSIPAVRFVEIQAHLYPDPAWENGSDTDFWFVEVIDVPETEERDHAMLSEEELETPQVIVVTRYWIAAHEVVPMQAARTRTLADAKYMIKQEIGR